MGIAFATEMLRRTKIETLHTQKRYSMWSQALGLILMLGLLASCSKNGGFNVDESSILPDSAMNGSSSLVLPTTPATVTAPISGGTSTSSVFSANYKPEALSWESSSHPERAAWSVSAYRIVAENFSALDQAQDIQTFCPQYDSLTKDERINLWADLFASTAFYECGWNPGSYSVDVGTANSKDTWSVGLLQLSVIDQGSYNLPLGFSFADLQVPAKNLELGVAIMARQIKKYGIVMIPTGASGLYWATLHPGGKYDESSAIATMTRKLSFCH